MSVSDEDLFIKFRQLQWLLARKQFQTTVSDGPLADTTRGQGRVIATLKRQQEASTKSLAFLLRISVPSLNELLSKLEKGGYVSRTPSPKDRRVMIVRLTDKGKQVEQNQVDPIDIFSIFTPEEHDDFAQYLDRLAQTLEADFEANATPSAQADWRNRPRQPMSAEELDQMIANLPKSSFDSNPTS